MALDALVEHFTGLLVGERETSSDDAIEYLRRDMRRERNKAVRSLLRVIRSDLHQGRTPDETARFSDALSSMIRTHPTECQGNLSDEIVGEGDIECVENPLEMRVLQGDETRPTLQKLGRVFRHHIQTLQRCERAVNGKLYGSDVTSMCAPVGRHQ